MTEPVAQARREGNEPAWRFGHSADARHVSEKLPFRSRSAFWTHDAALWNGEGTAVLLLAEAARDVRRQALRALASRIPGLDGPDISVLHRDGRGPLLMRGDAEIRRPALSSASRDGLAAVAVGSRALGVDIEIVGVADEIAWAVLADPEAERLRQMPRECRPAEFARIWSLKEAYLKALRVGLSRDPAGIRVRLGDDGAEIVDHLAMVHAQAETRWWRMGSSLAAVSLVVLDHRPA